MNAKTFFSDKPIAYHPILAKAFGSVTAALFLSQLAFWSDKGSDPSGWIWKTEREMEDETGLSRSEQETARKRLKEKGVLKEERRGVPARMWYLIDWDALERLLDNLPQTSCRKPANWKSKSSEQEAGKPANYSEITQEITSESTSNVVIAPLAHDDHDIGRAEKALEKAKSRPKASEAIDSPEPAFGQSYKLYEDRFGRMSSRTLQTFSELWDEFNAGGGNEDVLARVFDEAGQEMQRSVDQKRSAGDKRAHYSMPFFEAIVRGMLKRDYVIEETNHEDSEQIGCADGRDVHGATGEGIAAQVERVIRDAPQKSLSGVPRGRYYTTGPLSRLAAGTGASGGDGE